MNKREKEGLALVAAGPRYWITADALQNVSTIIGFLLDAPSLAVTGMAARGACALVIVPNWHEYAQLIDDGWSRDDRLLVPTLQTWYETSSAHSLREAHAFLVRHSLVRANGRLNIFVDERGNANRGIQSALANALRPHVLQFSCEDYLRNRWARWFGGAQITLCIRSANIVKCNMQGRVPPCVLYAVLITWLNGWCTSRRYQQSVGKCRLYPECEGLDELEHYVRCPFAWEAAPRFAHLGDAPTTLQEALVLGQCDADTCVRRAVMIYAIYGTFNAARAADSRLSRQVLALKLLERFRTASQMHPFISRLFSWNAAI